MEIDLHIHTNRYSGCSNLDPLALVRRARRIGLDGIALTEHGIRWTDEDIAALRSRAKDEHLLVLPGEEAACYDRSGRFQGEFLVFGYPRSLGSSRSIEDLSELVHGEGGVILAAHPFKKTKTGEGFYGAGYGVYDYSLDGLETAHPSYDADSASLARAAEQSLKIAGIGSSDAHDLRSVGLCRTRFFDVLTDLASLCRAIRERRLEALSQVRLLAS
ncbi:MAG: PHP domain protein [Syntrophaceae bacterium PtaB.Bin095]|jgi:predicted metal-dependent phosphoesterase TrpH|nr:MAG: PHP domain protein [Syntrophaceae bacterium PtaB.Bin095]